jgi:hypothetical protein
MSFQRIVAGLAKIETALKQCVSSLNTQQPIPVLVLSETIGNCAKALQHLQPIISELVKAEDNQSFIICCVREYALELLFSLDETQAAYKPRTHADNVELVHELLELIDEDEPSPQLASEEINSMSHKTFPPAFSEAMHRHIQIVEQLGEEHPEAKRSFMVAMHLVPDWFNDDIADMGNEIDLLPQASGYLEDGSPMFSLNDIAEKFGVSIEQAEQDLQTMMSVRQELGLPLDGVMTDSSLIHRKQ